MVTGDDATMGLVGHALLEERAILTDGWVGGVMMVAATGEIDGSV